MDYPNSYIAPWGRTRHIGFALKCWLGCNWNPQIFFAGLSNFCHHKDDLGIIAKWSTYPYLFVVHSEGLHQTPSLTETVQDIVQFFWVAAQIRAVQFVNFERLLNQWMTLIHPSTLWDEFFPFGSVFSSSEYVWKRKVKRAGCVYVCKDDTSPTRIYMCGFYLNRQIWCTL